MADNTSGGTTASLSNTPQAKADTFYRGEDLTGITMLDVMLNDLAGNAKILWSVDDSATDAAGATDLVCTDIGKIEATSTDTSANGAKIWIQDGKVAYQSDSLNAAFKAALQALAVGQTITDTFTYAIRMSNGTLSWNTATIVFTGANDGPVANADSNDADLVTEAGVNPGNVPFPGNPSASGNVLANDTDVDNGAVLTVKEVNGSTANVGNLVPGAYGSVTINGNGSWTYNLDNGDDDTQALAQGESVTETFSYMVTDEHGATSTSTLTITIIGTNDGPVANPDSGTTSENAALLVDVLANDSDVDNGHVLTVTAASTPAGQGSASIVGNQVEFDPGSDFDHLNVGDSVTVTVSYTIEDEHGASSSSTVDILVTGTNDGPVANPDSGSTSENATVLVDVLANDTDVDNGHTLTVVSANAPVGQGSASVVGNQVEFDPGADFDHLAVGDSVVVTVSYTIEDEHGASSSSTIDITVTGTNDAPELSASLTGHTYLDTSADDSFGNVSGTLSTDDPDDGDMAAYSIDGGVADDSRPGFNISSSSAYGTLYLDSTTGAYEFVPADGTIEGLKSDDSVSFTLTVTDSQGASDSETLTINLDGANDTPEAPPTNSVTTDEDNASAATAIGASDRDAGEVLTYSVKSGGEPDHGSVSFDQAAGTFVYAPDANYHGGDSFTILVTDASGATTEQIVDVTVNSVNDAPAAAGTNSVTTDEDNASGAVVIGASDVDGDTLTYSVKPGGDPAHGSVSFDQVAGTFVYTPDPNYNGDDNFTILIDDGNGGTAEQVVGVTVNPVNDAPTSANGSNSTDEDQALNSTLPAAADVDGDSVAYALGTNAANGNAVVNADGTFSYTPNPDFNGSDSFTFTVSDGNGGSNSYTYEVTVNPVNDAPTSANGSNSTDEDQPLNGSLPAATDVDGDSVTYALDTNATNGSAVVNADGTFTYTPSPDFNGSDSFTFTVSDGNGGSNSYTYEVTVNPVNDAPNSANGSNSTDEDQPLNGSLPAASDVDGDSVTYSLDANAANGNAVVNADGTFSYTPNPDFNGSDSFTFTVSDGNGGSNTYAYEVTVNPVNDAAVITGDDSGTVVEDTIPNSVSGNLDSTDVDNDDDSWSAVVSATASASGFGTYTVDAAGNWVYTLDNSDPDVDALNVGDTLSDSFIVYSQDGTAQTVTITIEGTNDLPSVSGDLLGEVTEAGLSNGGGVATVIGTAIVEDVDNPDIFEPASGASDLGYGTYSIDADGNWSYTLDNDHPTVKDLNDGDTLEDHFQITSDDGTVTQITITINGATDAIAPPPTETGADPNDFDTLVGTNAANNSATIVGSNSLGDNITGGSADQDINGRGGNDSIYGAGGNDDIDGGADNDMLYGQAGDDDINGNNGLDSVYGGSGDDDLVGGNEADTLYGGSDNDTIVGNNGNDVIIGGYGQDMLTGGGDNDTFRYLNTLDTNDIIVDFMAAGNDQIDLSAIDATPGGLDDPFEWGGTTATEHGVWFSYDADSNTTTLYADTDGNEATAELMLTLQGYNGLNGYSDPLGPPPPDITL